MRAARINPWPWIGPVRKLCAAKKQRAMKHPECLAPGTGRVKLREMKLGPHIDHAHSISIGRLGEKYYLMIVIDGIDFV